MIERSRQGFDTGAVVPQTEVNAHGNSSASARRQVAIATSLVNHDVSSCRPGERLPGTPAESL